MDRKKLARHITYAEGPIKRKDLNKIRVYDDEMAKRHMTDLKLRFPRAFNLVSLIIVAMMFVFSIFGFFQLMVLWRM